MEDKPCFRASPASGGDDNIRYEASYPKNASLTPSRPGRKPYMELSPTGRSTVPSGEHAELLDWMSRAGERIPASSREAGRYADIRSNNQNAVDTERIRLGLDVRTTVSFSSVEPRGVFNKYWTNPVTKIMLRNIPNKIDQVGLHGNLRTN